MTLKVPLKDRVSAVVALTKEEADHELPRLETQVATLLPQIQLALPAGMDPQQMVRDMIQLVRKQPKLVMCEPTSVLGAMMTCAQLGLRPGVPSLGQADILPFWNKKLEVPGRKAKGGYEATFVIGYQGMIELINRSGKAASVDAREVYHGEEFEVEFGSNARIVHRPDLDEFMEQKDLRGFYCVIQMVNGGTYFDYWPLKKMEHHRDRFALAKYVDQTTKKETIVGPWRDHFVAMGKKTMIRQAFKLAPRATDLTFAMSTDYSVRHNTEALGSLQELAEAVQPVDPDDAGAPIEGDVVEEGIPENFKHDTRPGAPTREEQWALIQQERAGQ